MADVAVAHLSRHFGRLLALDDVSFDVADGEFVTLLGPSGCGKSTTLAALAGLDRPTAGTIRIGGRTLFDGASGIFVDAQFRNLGLMFQSYALWPHMTVFQNLDFTLELRRIRGAAARQRIEEALALSDRIIVMNQGRIAQIGTPREIYQKPADLFVADFVGASNILDAELCVAGGGGAVARLPGGQALDVPAGAAPGPVALAIRPERILVAPPPAAANRLGAEVEAVSYLGARNLVVARIGPQRVRIELDAEVAPGAIEIALPAEAISVFARTA